MDSIRGTVEPLWRELIDSPFDEEDFINGVMLDCGHDASGISRSDFLQMLNTGHCAALHEMGWCCDEVLAGYLASDHLSNAEFVRAVFIALCGVRAIEKGLAHWDFIFEKILRLLVANLHKVDYDFPMEFLRQILCR